ncbi:O-antigen ligase family protein [Variovorax phage VarioGold]|uniref:hypothetical protein n=1 Tax=Variovorax sp. ZS18.2.2 TaxID=2971255 RepID=UPI0021518A65|nr:hypothetical protein [Variovorax sp. ZS18.2.2]MCR6477513.1 hypothetical protein [Variovorax sp. ZS18.2.2]UYD72073.1 O-antigen ligase family protein [Variovorax phage VarioGold]
MDIRLSTIRALIPEWSFLILFPGFFFYHTMAGYNLFPPVLGGFFSPMSVLLFPFLFMVYVQTVTKDKTEFTGTDQLFFLYVAFFVLVLAFSFVGQKPIELIAQHAVSIIHLGCCFFIFKTIDFRSKSFRRIAFACLIAMTVLIFMLSVDGTFYLRQDAADGSDAIASYQGFSRSYLMTAIALVAFTDRLRVRLIIYAVCIPSLYLAVARSEFAAFFLFACVMEIISSKKPMAMILTIAVIAGVTYSSLEVITTLLPENRVLELLVSGESTSGDARDEYSVAALRTITDNVFLGDYGSYIPTTGVGSEAHNILSAWVDLGFTGFALLSFILLRSATQFVKFARSRSTRSLNGFKLALCLLLMTIFLLLTAKDFTYMLVGAALGICSAYMAYRRRERRAEEQALPAAIWQQAA